MLEVRAMDAKQYIGLDVGEARVGFARGSSVARLAEPLFTMPQSETLQKLATMIAEQETAAIVVGMPRNLSGEQTKQTQWVREWVGKAKAKIDLPFYAQDEALTSVKAKSHAYQQAGLNQKVKNADVDALAAAIILQDFLDSTEAQRVVW